MDKLKQIEAFVGAVDTGSLARAALVADVTPVMIGRRIDALEKRLGVRLLLRSTRRLALTEQGNVYLEYCRKLLADLEHADNLIFEGRHTAAGHLALPHWRQARDRARFRQSRLQRRRAAASLDDAGARALLAVDVGDPGGVEARRTRDCPRRVRAAVLRHHGRISAAAARTGEGALFHRAPEANIFGAGLL